MTIGKIKRKSMGVEVGTGIDRWPTLNYCNLNSVLRQVGSKRASPCAGANDTHIKDRFWHLTS